MGVLPGIGTILAGARSYVAPTYVGGTDYAAFNNGVDFVLVNDGPNGTRLAGDIMLWLHGSTTTSGDSGGPSGFTYYGDSIYSGSTRMKLWWKRLTSDGEDATPPNTQGTFITVRGVDAGTPIADFRTEFLTTSNTTVNFPGATAVRENSFVIAAAYVLSNRTIASWTNASVSLTERQDASLALSSAVLIFDLATGIMLLPGAIDANGTATISSAHTNKTGVLIVLNPA